MPFISELLNRPALAADGTRLGKLHDLLTTSDTPYPPVSLVAITPKGSRQTRLLPWIHVQYLDKSAIHLDVTTLDEMSSASGDAELWLARDVLDKQIVDVEGAKLVRVNDIQLTRINRDLRVAAVDNSGRGLLRRLGIERLASLPPHHKSHPTLIDWEEIDLVPGPNQDVKLKVPYSRLRRLHPAEIADVVGQLSPSEGAHALESMDDETAALALAELSPEHATAVLNAMDEEEAADILEEMAADDAADILADLDAERAADLMSRMESAAAKDVQQLMTYPEDTAGGLMNTDFVAIPERMTAGDVIDYLRRSTPEARDIYDLYVTDSGGHLAGTLSLRDVVVSPPEQAVAAIMDRDIVTLPVMADDAEVARILIKYNLVVVPVVDEHNQLVGIISVDDVLDLVAPRSWHNRPRRMLA